MTSLPIPSTMDEVDAAWLTAALREVNVVSEATVTAAHRERIGEGVGILGELARITLEYDRNEPGAPASLIAKIPTADPGGRGVAHMLGFYQKEARFYTDLYDHVGVRSARGYYTAGDPETVRFIILMEDLSALELGDQVKGATAEECNTLLTEVAKLHAGWWQSTRLDELDWLDRVNSDVNKLSALGFAQSVEPFLKNFGHHLTGDERQMVVDFMHRMIPMLDEGARDPVTLCHGDLRLDNVFWGSPDGDAPLTLIDWQIAAKARGPYDIAYFLSQSVDPAERAANEERLVRDYHQQLATNGVTGYSFDDCWRDYRLSTMFCLAYPVIACGSVDLANERGLELATAMLKRSLSAIRDLKATELLYQLDPVPHPMLA